MVDSELIDNIVSNETLGIKKKPSVLKIAFIGIVILIAAILAYSFYMKAKADVEQPHLNLGQPLSNPQQQTTPIASDDAVSTQSSSIQPPVTVATVTPIQPAAMANAEVKSLPGSVAPITNVTAGSQIAPVTSGAIKPASVSIKPSEAELPKIQPQVIVANPAIDISSSTTKKPEPVKRKKVVKKVEVKEVKTVKTEGTKTDSSTEEGVTREEIIVIQKED